MAFPVGWQRQQPIVIPASLVPATLTNFPVPVTAASLGATADQIFDADGSAPARADGGDIRFSSDAAGATQLAREVVEFTRDNNPASGTCQIWVGIPSISSSVDTTIYIWWGAAAETEPLASATYGSEAVWDSTYDGVYHCEDNPATSDLLDSTDNDNHMTFEAGMDGTNVDSGKIGNAIDIKGGQSEYAFVNTASVPKAFPYSMSMWGKPELNAAVNLFGLDLADKDSTARYSGIHVEHTVEPGYANAWTHTYGVGSPTLARSLAAATGGAYNHYVAIFNGASDRDVILNAGTPVTDTTTVGTAVNNHDRIAFGYTGDATPLYGGKDLSIDEPRVSSSARSEAWYDAEYNAGNAPGTFCAGGSAKVMECNIGRQATRSTNRGVSRGVA